MGRPRKKTEEETPQAEEQATEELASEQTPAEAPAEEKPKRTRRKKTEPAAEEPVAEQPAEPDSADEGAPPPDEVGAGQAPPATEQAAAEEPPAEEQPPLAEEPPAAEEAPAPEDAPPAEEPAAEAAAPEAPPVKKKRKRLPRAQRRQRPKVKRQAAGERKAIARLPKPEAARGQRKERRGIVVSSVVDKTIVVRVETVKPHRVYKKVVRRSAKFHAHDERNVAKAGDLVRIVESRPYSKTKKWRLAEVLEEAK